MGTATNDATYTTTDVLPKTFGLYILYVSQWEKALTFYKDALGWELTVHEQGCWAEFATGGVRFALHSAEAETPGSDTHLSFFVADVDASITALRDKGVEITSEPKSVCEGTRSATFSDPFGNLFHLTGK